MSRKSLNDIADICVDCSEIWGVDCLFETGELDGGRECFVEEEIDELEIGSVLGEMLDGVAAVTEDAGLAVDEGYGGDAG